MIMTDNVCSNVHGTRLNTGYYIKIKFKPQILQVDNPANSLSTLVDPEEV